MLTPVGMKALTGLTIKEISLRTPEMTELRHYNAYRILTECGRTFIVWNSMGETNCSEVTE